MDKGEEGCPGPTRATAAGPQVWNMSSHDLTHHSSAVKVQIATAEHLKS